MAIVILLFASMFVALQAQSGLDRQIGFDRIVADDVNFTALENYLEKNGNSEFVQELEKKAGYLKVSENSSGRYFAIARIQDIQLWQVSHASPANAPLVLVMEVKLRALVYDTLEQSEILRETFAASVAQKADGKPTQALDLCKTALMKSARMLGQALVNKMPVRGKVTAVSGTVITVNLGKNHSVNDDSILEVTNKKGELVDEFSALPGKIFADEAKAVSSRDIEIAGMDWRNFSVRCRNKAGEQFDNNRQKLIQAALPGMKPGSPSEKQLPPNPPVRFAVTDPRDQHEIYLGSEKDPGSTTLKAACWDAWGDQLEIDPGKVNWTVKGNPDMVSGSQFVHKRVGTFDVEAQYESFTAAKIQIHINRIKGVVLEPRHVTLLPKQACDFTLAGINTKDQQMNAASIGYQVEWQMSTPGVVEVVNNRLVAGDKPGKCIVTAQLKNEPAIKAQMLVVVLPPLDLQIVDLQERPLRKVTLAPGEDLELQYKIATPGIDTMDVPLEWQITPKEAGKGMITGTDLLFTAGTTAMKRVVIEVVMKNVPANSSRGDDLKPLYVEIEPKRADKVVITSLSPEPFVRGEPIQLQVQGLSENKVVKDLEFKVVSMPSAGSDIKPEELRGYYTVTPSQPGRITVVAVENFSGQEARLPLQVMPETSQVTRVEIATQNGKREVRPGESLLFIGKALIGQKEAKDCKLVWSLAPRAKKTAIDNGGLLTAGGEDEVGEYTVSVSEEKSGKSDSMKIQLTLEPVAGIKIQVPEKLEIGVKYPLAATLLDKDGNFLYNRKIVWTTSGGGTVENNFLSSDKPGLIRLLAKAENVQESQVIEVTKPQVAVAPTTQAKKPLAVTRIVLSNDENKSELAPGEILHFRTQAFDGNKPVDTTELKLKWSVSEAEHKIERDGLFTAGRKIGATVVTVKDSVGGQSQAFKVRVRWQPVAKIVVAVSNSALQPGQSTPLTYRLYDDKNQEIAKEKSKISWKTTGGTIDEEKLVYTASLKPGTYRVWAIDASERNNSNVVSVTVKEKEIKAVLAFDKLVPFPQTKELEVGQSCNFDIKGFNSKTGKWVPDVSVTWRIEPPTSEHTIDDSGQFAAGTQTGNFQIVAELAGEDGKPPVSPLKAVATVVVKRTPQKITVSPRVVKLAPGMSKQFSAVVYDAMESAIPTAVAWSCTGNNTFDAKTATFTAGPVAGVYEVRATLGNLMEKAQVEIVVASALTNFLAKTTFGISYKIHKDWQMQMSDDGNSCFYFADKTMQSRVELSIHARDQFPTLDQLLAQLESQMLDQMPGMQNMLDTNKYEQKHVEDYTLGRLSGKLVSYLISYKVDAYGDDASEDAVRVMPTVPDNKAPDHRPPIVINPKQPNMHNRPPQNIDRRQMRNWRQMPRVIRREKKYIRVHKFVFTKGNSWYTAGCVAPLQEWEIHWPSFKASFDSLDVTAPANPPAEFVTVSDPVYNVSYQIVKGWNEDSQSASGEEKSVVYSIDDAWLQIDFLENPGQLDEEQIRAVENELFADWYGVCARMSLENVSINGFFGRKATYVLNKGEERNKYYAVMFGGVRNDRLYVIHYIHSAEVADTIGKQMETVLNSFTVKENRSIVPRNLVTKIEITAPKRVEIGKKVQLAAVVFGRNGRKIERRVIWNAAGNATVDATGSFTAGQHPGVVRVSAEAHGVREAVLIEVVKPGGKQTIPRPPVDTRPPVDKKPPVDTRPPANWTVVRDKQFGLHYQVPEHWNKQSREDEDDKKIAYHHPQHKLVALVFHFSDDDYASAQALAGEFETGWRSFKSFQRKARQEIATEKGLRGLLCHYTYTDKKQENWVVRAFYFVHAGNAYVCVGKSPLARAAEMEPIFDRAIQLIEPQAKKKSGGDKKPKKQKKNREEEDD